jgi:hypothetical protein
VTDKKTFEDLELRLRGNLKLIRETLDADVVDSDILNIQNKLLSLTQLSGLAAESKGTAKKLLEVARLKAFMKAMDDGTTGNLAMVQINALCADQAGMLEYADRICSSITVTCDSLRSVISLHKSELENSLK